MTMLGILIELIAVPHMWRDRKPLERFHSGHFEGPLFPTVIYVGQHNFYGAPTSSLLFPPYLTLQNGFVSIEFRSAYAAAVRKTSAES
jgi:hypothetical protein